MQFQDFMRYTDFACQYALMPRFEWKGRSTRQQPTWMRKIIFIMSGINLIYTNISLCVYGYLLDRKSMDPLQYVIEISDTGSMLGFTVCGAFNMLVLLIYRPQIEDMLAQLQDLFEQREKLNYQTRYYFENFTSLTKKFTVFYVLCNVYYNSVPAMIIISNFLSKSEELRYKLQTPSWYPWDAMGSVPGFCAAYISQVFSSSLNVALMMVSQYLVHLCTAQLEIHFIGLAKQLEALDARELGAKKKLKSLIVHHRRLLQLADDISSIFNFTFLASLTITTISICVMAFNLTTLNLITAVKYSLGMVFFNIYTFSLCHNGTQVTWVVSGRASQRLL